MRPLSLILLLVLLPAISAEDCVGYTDRFTVIVTDHELRAIEGAAVQVTFDRGASFGEQYFTTEPKYTGADGKAAYNIYNQGTDTRDIDCDIVIAASISGVDNETTVLANKHSDNILITLDISPITITVQDQHGNVLEGAKVSIDNLTKETGSSGKVRFYLPVGEHEYLASYESGKQTGTIPVSESAASTNIVIKHHPIEISVIDDYGNSLESSIFIFNQTFELPYGLFEVEKAYGDEIEYITSYGGLEKPEVIYPGVEGTVRVVYDLNPPIFGEIESTADAEVTRLVIPVSDEGQYASGVDYSSIMVSYRLEPAEATTPWNSAVTFVSALNTFMADFPELPKNSIVQFRIEVKDNEGNKATIDGRFSPPQPEDNNNETGENGGETHENGEAEQEIPFLDIVAGAFIVLLVIFLVSRIKRS